MPGKFYITSAVPYPNGAPHLGFGLEIVLTDVLARYHRLRGEDVWFLTGTDEHGLKVFQSAKKEGIDFQDYVDKNSKEFARLKEVLNISYDDFIRTSDKIRHWPGAQKLWISSKKDIYLKKYSGLYCVGCEAFVTERELINGMCPEHKIEPEKVEEENYFFKLKNYRNEIEKLIERNEIKILPESRKNEALNLLKDAEDFSISRPKEKISWGIPVPDDPNQIQYVWFDALASYITAVGYGREDSHFSKWWPVDIHLIGKGILRFHAIHWLAMLLSAGLSLPKSIYVHGYLTIAGEKISKSLGNAVSPEEVAKKYGIDPVRYYLLREIPSYEDGDYSEKKFEARYNADLANNLGNLVLRVVALIEKFFNASFVYSQRSVSKEIDKRIIDTWKKYIENIDNFKLHIALENTFSLVDLANSYIDEHKPWALSENPEKLKEVITNLVVILLNVAWLLKPFLPETSNNIFEILGADKDGNSWEDKPFRVKSKILFPRI